MGLSRTLSLSLLLAILAPATADRAVAQAKVGSPDSESAEQGLAARYEKWLEEVDPLITLAEREVFLGLTRDHHREAFIRQFWRMRDPYPQTARNELKERWDERMYIVQTE